MNYWLVKSEPSSLFVVATVEGWQNGVDGRPQLRGATQPAGDEKAMLSASIHSVTDKQGGRPRARGEGILSRRDRRGGRLVVRGFGAAQAVEQPVTLEVIKADRILKEMKLSGNPACP